MLYGYVCLSNLFIAVYVCCSLLLVLSSVLCSQAGIWLCVCAFVYCASVMLNGGGSMLFFRGGVEAHQPRCQGCSKTCCCDRPTTQ